ITVLLANMRKANSASSQGKTRPILMTADESPAARRNAAIRRALEKTVNLDYEDKPLEDVIADVGRHLDIPIWFDRMAFTDAGVAMDQPVTVHLRGISGHSALALILEPARLDWVIEEELLKVTIPGCESLC